MRQRNDVFFFTFIDLLLQVIFVGLLLFAVPLQGKLKEIRDQREKATELSSLYERYGVSNIVELNDKLSRMVPADQCIPSSECKADHEFLRAAGGKEAVRKQLDQLRESYGTPPCEKMVDEKGRPMLDRKGAFQPVSIATLRVGDDSVAFEESEPSPVLSKLLSALRLRYADVRRLDLPTFRKSFERPEATGPNGCRHFVTIRAITALRRPVDMVRNVFPQNGPTLGNATPRDGTTRGR